MIKCYGSWLLAQREAELDREDRIQRATDKVDEEIFNLLKPEFEEVYEEFIKSDAYEKILRKIAERKYPAAFGLKSDDY